MEGLGAFPEEDVLREGRLLNVRPSMSGHREPRLVDPLAPAFRAAAGRMEVLRGPGSEQKAALEAAGRLDFELPAPRTQALLHVSQIFLERGLRRPELSPKVLEAVAADLEQRHELLPQRRNGRVE